LGHEEKEQALARMGDAQDERDNQDDGEESRLQFPEGPADAGSVAPPGPLHGWHPGYFHAFLRSNRVGHGERGGVNT
jgi:hypothetical protein